MNSNKTQRQPFIYHVCRKDIEDEQLDKLVHRFWKIEAEGTLPEQYEDSSLDQLAEQTMENSICCHGERYQNETGKETPEYLFFSSQSTKASTRTTEKRSWSQPEVQADTSNRLG